MALYLGIDLSTQGVKAELIDPENPAAGSGGFAVGFGADLPQYGAPEGFVPDPGGRGGLPGIGARRVRPPFRGVARRRRSARGGRRNFGFRPAACDGLSAGVFSACAREPRPREDAGGTARSVSVAPLFPELDGPFDGAGVPGT